MRTLLNPYGRRWDEARRRIRGKERRMTGKIEEDGSFPIQIVTPRVRIRKIVIPLHPDRKKNEARRHHVGHTDLKEQEKRQ
jgi:hypothetical protein